MGSLSGLAWGDFLRSLVARWGDVATISSAGGIRRETDPYRVSEFALLVMTTVGLAFTTGPWTFVALAVCEDVS